MSKLKDPIMALEPSLWETLPNELLHLLFAHLPIVGIGQLRVLSKEWKRNVDCKDSEFNRQVFDVRAHLNMFGLLFQLYHEAPNGEMLIDTVLYIYDVQADKWHEIRNWKEVVNFVGVDGGLLYSYWGCYPKQAGYDEYIFSVINLLANQEERLPPLRCLHVETFDNPRTRVRMIKLTMDKKTKDYKVFVVRSANDGQGFLAQVYNSCTKEWTVVEATHGHIIEWDFYKLDFSDYTLNVYNCANGTLQHFDEICTAPKLKVEHTCCVLLEDHLFVLHEETSLDPTNLLEANEGMLQKYCISEFHLPEKSTAWVKLRVHSCKFIYNPLGCFKLKLYGCSGFLLVHDCGSKSNWLYNLSTCKWHIFPTFRKLSYLKGMHTISWSAIA